MRSTSWMTRGALCAFALSICVPALATAARGHKSLADCTAFDQEDQGDDAVKFTVHNSCSVPVDCAIHWRVICAPDAPKRKAFHEGSAKLSLGEMASGSTDASAGSCGDDSWAMDQIEWSCQPNKD